MNDDMFKKAMAGMANDLKNLDDKGADYLCEKLNEKIKELENNI